MLPLKLDVSYRLRVMALPRLIRKLRKSFQALIQAIGTFLLQSLFLPLKKKAGFVLPTATLVLLVVSLLVGTLVIRTGQEAEEAISQKAQQEIFNAATPAVDRAKAKIEFLFQDDPRFPAGIPGEAFLNSMMLNDGDEVAAEDDDPYTICEEDDCSGDNDETRLDIDGDGENDNAWEYTTEAGETIAYSINMFTENNGEDYRDSELEDKADNLIVRAGPLNANRNNLAQRCAGLQRLSIDNDWFSITGSTLRKNFQIDAVATNESDVNPAVSTIEVQQARDLTLGNQWGAWFRYDLEFTPGSNFDWNGAMHTEGSLVINNNGGNTTSLRLVSSPESCFYTESASRITMAEDVDEDGNTVYQGQVMRVNTDNNNFQADNDDQVEVDLFPGRDEAPSDDTPDTLELALSEDNDSVDPPNNNPSLYYLDPVRLISEDLSRARNTADDSNQDVRDEANWDDQDSPTLNDRMFNDTARQPFLDDTYRADDRWGPKPNYNDTEELSLTENDNGSLIQDEPLLTYNPPADDAENAGLDGYWERRANSEGLRIIVGERLELGNREGWEGNNDPLYRQNTEYNDLDEIESAERDNLAAVQAGAVYHWQNHETSTADPDPEPVACVALTSHQNGGNDTTFQRIDINGNTFIETNFFAGRGTNGWEFPFYDDFATDINDNGANPSDLYIALRNLARFAGDFDEDSEDQDGAFPPLQEDGGNITHPFPELAMWGNFSNLRRAIGQLEDGDDYDDLSIADKTTIQTATCTLGMLAYNIDNAQLASERALGVSNLQSEGVDLSQLLDGTCSNGNPEIIDPALYSNGNGNQGNNGNQSCNDSSNSLFDESNWEDEIDNSDPNSPSYVPDCDNDDLNGFTPGCDEPDVYNSFTAEEILTFAGYDEQERIELLAQGDAIASQDQIDRDREFGFGETLAEPDSDNFSGDVPYDSNSRLAGPEQIGGASEVYIRSGCSPNTFEDVTAQGNGQGSNQRARMGLALVLCQDALQPKYPSLHYLFPLQQHGHNDGQPNAERYINSNYIANTVNNGINYEPLSDIANLELEPKFDETTPSPFSEFSLPEDTDGDTNPITFIETDGTTSQTSVSLLDKAFYNHRENMTVRVLDIDLDLLRNNSTNGDFWLPTGNDNSGIVYAFREDAVREDAIARPSNESWANCNSDDDDSELEEQQITGFDNNGTVLSDLTTSDNCRMLFNTPQDPPLNDDTGVSVKPVDSYPDPDRRPYGFRLRNGSSLVRDGFDGNATDNDPTGLSFITDQAVYIQGDFNVHDLEEFTDSGESFYERDTLDDNFATTNGESWRPAEIIADGITLLSDSDNFEVVDENGDNNNPGSSGNIEVNAILVSALTPSFPGKYNGGIHNFPRFLEDWGTVTIRGSFIQLNFSKYSTGSYDRDNLDSENPSDLNNGSNLPYYGAPNRNWGYDVGLQYNPPGPVAERFVANNNTITETYRELSVNDPYIENLLDAINN